MSQLLINYMSAKSVRKRFLVKDEYTLCFPNFLIIGLFNSSARHAPNCWSDVVLFLITPPEILAAGVADVLSKNP